VEDRFVNYAVLIFDVEDRLVNYDVLQYVNIKELNDNALPLASSRGIPIKEGLEQTGQVIKRSISRWCSVVASVKAFSYR
jgi:hypothetical protein